MTNVLCVCGSVNVVSGSFSTLARCCRAWFRTAPDACAALRAFNMSVFASFVSFLHEQVHPLSEQTQFPLYPIGHVTLHSKPAAKLPANIRSTAIKYLIRLTSS